jgi:hypothetical protein
MTVAVKAAGPEAAFRRTLTSASGTIAGPEVERWDFLNTVPGRADFCAAKLAASSIYLRKNPETDAEVRWQLGIIDCSSQLGQEALELPVGETPPPPPGRHRNDEGCKGQLRLLSISDVHFSHNDQSEHFKHCTKDCSILQLAVELIGGITPLEAVPIFTVCWHDGQWYCRSGNRRLAAIILASIFAPHRFHTVWVKVVATDSIFLHGGDKIASRPKLTTHLNGEACQGRWLLIKETGEVVGHPNALDAPPYGSDLLALLPQPKVGADAPSNTG